MIHDRMIHDTFARHRRAIAIIISLYWGRRAQTWSSNLHSHPEEHGAASPPRLYTSCLPRFKLRHWVFQSMWREGAFSGHRAMGLPDNGEFEQLNLLFSLLQ